MSGISGATGPAVSGMRHAANMLQASASNVANLMSDGYQARRVTGETAPGGGVRSVVSVSTQAGAAWYDSATGELLQRSNTELETELVTQSAAAFMYAANAAVIRAEDEMYATLLDRQI